MTGRRHPVRADLALFLSGDLAPGARIGIRWHLARCEDCRRELETFRQARTHLRGQRFEDAIPAGLDWERVAADMTANIRLGLAAGEIVGEPRQPEPSHLWRAAVVMASILMLAGSVIWWYHRTYNPETPVALSGPLRVLAEQVKSEPAKEAPGEVVLKATLGGIGVEQDGQALALAAEDDAGPRGVTASMQGSLNARYVDEDGSEVTIHRVYSE
ncbi:MAG: zf-HC2 domain-containing protein [Bryobacteraceae bacterium]